MTVDENDSPEHPEMSRVYTIFTTQNDRPLSVPNHADSHYVMLCHNVKNEAFYVKVQSESSAE